MELTFFGATRTVTGSKFLLNFGAKKFLVDCGLFQGYKELRNLNWQKFPIDPATINAVILTHAHIDHSGYLPLLVKNGFKGPIYCSPGTYELCKILLTDSGYLQEEEARIANLLKYSRHQPALPLYTKQDAENSLRQFVPVEFGHEYNLENIATFSLHHAGHILGAALVQIKFADSSVLFSGDLGRLYDPIMRAPAKMQNADYLILESTYGDRVHDKTDPEIFIADVINRTIKHGGVVVIPAFAVGRAQAILYYIYELKRKNKIPDVPVFLDSPMAIKATEAFCHYPNEYRLSTQLCLKIYREVNYVETIEESTELQNFNGPMIIVSASGMIAGGRILHHLQVYLPDPRNSVLFIGYQAGGTRGDRLVNGDPEIKIYGKIVPVAAKIYSINNLSAHADSDEIMQWLKNFTYPPRKVFLVHGEEHSATVLQEKIKQELRWDCLIPSFAQSFQL